MDNSGQKKAADARVSVSCTHCERRFTVPSVELEASRKITCPACKKSFVPIFTEGTERKGR